MKSIFENIIRNRYWADSLCGTGSTMDFTYPLRLNLPDVLKRHNINSMLDAPCGDHSWFSTMELHDGFVYNGADIVIDLIKQNRVDYPGVNFSVLDISQDPLPTVDLLFCRDCLIHFSDEDVVCTLKNIAQSSIKYVMLTTYDDSCYNNVNINTGEFRPISFTQKPYQLLNPLESILDWVPGTRNQNQIKYMTLWHIDSIRDHVNSL